MVDYYSNFPPPRSEAIKKVVIDYPNFHQDKLLEICTKVVNDMPSLGSYTG